MPTIAEQWALGDSELSRPGVPLFVGLECEIESIIKSDSKVGHIFRIETDGSLRNDGLEFISPPIPVYTAVPAFSNLHCNIRHYNEKEKFSQRTSIHVHVNCLNLSCESVKNVILLYALFEEFFFLQVEPGRRHNIHCVPLTETVLPNFYSADLATMVYRWHKYTALNIKPLGELGTIEFRHMQGHDDAELLKQWLTTIENLFSVGTHKDFDIRSINETTIKDWFMDIFGHTKLAIYRDFLHMQTENQLTDIKLSLI